MLVRRSMVAALAVLLLTTPVASFAQTGATRGTTAIREIGVGRTVWVTDAQGNEITGTVTDQTDTTIDIATRTGERRSLLSDVVKISRKDSNWDGVAKGVTTGSIAMLGVAWYENRQHREPSDLLPALLLGIGGVIGAWIDDAAEHRDVIYERPRASKTVLTISPILGLEGVRRAGIAGSISWR